MSGDATLKHVLEKFPELLQQFIWLALTGVALVALSFHLDAGTVRTTLQIAGAALGTACTVATFVIVTHRAIRAIAGVVSRRKLRAAAADVAALPPTAPELPEASATPELPPGTREPQVVRALSDWERKNKFVESGWENAHPAQRKIVMQIYEAGEGLFTVGSTEDAVAMTLIDDGFLVSDFAIHQPDGTESSLYRLSEQMYWILDYQRWWDSAMKYLGRASAAPPPPAASLPAPEPSPPQPVPADPSAPAKRAAVKVIQRGERSVKRR